MKCKHQQPILLSTLKKPEVARNRNPRILLSISEVVVLNNGCKRIMDYKVLKLYEQPGP